MVMNQPDPVQREMFLFLDLPRAGLRHALIGHWSRDHTHPAD